MDRKTITCKLTMRWWLRVYLECVVLTSLLTGLEPDWHKVGYWIGRGVKITPLKK